MTLLWKKPSWPSFSWSNSELIDQLVQARFEQGRVLAICNPFVHSFEIADRTQALYEDLMTEAPLNLERISGWQASLFPTGYSGVKKIRVAELREKDFSSEINKAASIPFSDLPSNTESFLSWWKEPPVDLDPLIRSALAFFWFLSLSPFEDGNYTLACAIAELALQQNERSRGRLYDVSLTLRENRSEVLKEIYQAQIGNGDLTKWIRSYLSLFTAASENAFSIAQYDRSESEFWKSVAPFTLNERQKKVLKHLFDTSTKDITNRDYVVLTETSRESAKRDLKELVQLGLLEQKLFKGRSVSYRFDRTFSNKENL